MADVTIYYLHIRAFGKGFCEFYQQARGMGVEFVKAKIGRIDEKEDGNLLLRYEDFEDGKVKEAEHDLVVLSVGILANTDYSEMFKNGGVKHDEFNYIIQSDELCCPAKTSIEGVICCRNSLRPNGYTRLYTICRSCII